MTRLSWIDVFVSADWRVDPATARRCEESVTTVFCEVCESHRVIERSGRHSLDSARIEVFIINSGQEGPYLGDHARVYEDSTRGREASGTALVLVPDWTDWAADQRLAFVRQCMEEYFNDISGHRGKMRSMPAGARPRPVLWRWIEAGGDVIDPDKKLNALDSAVADYSRDRLLRLGDDIIAALALIDTPEHHAAASQALGPLDEDRFAELRGFVVLLGKSVFDDFHDNHKLPQLPPNDEWSPPGESLRFPVSNRLGWDPWDRF